MNLQIKYDLAVAEEKELRKIKRAVHPLKEVRA